METDSSLEQGIIIEEKNSTVLVEAEPQGSCSTCAIKGHCMMGTVDKKRTIWIENTIGAKKGDPVSFRIEARGVVLASSLLYLFPVILLMLGLVSGYLLYDRISMERDLASALFGFAGLILAFIIIKLISGITQKKQMFAPTLVEITKNPPAPPA
ncbi:MAG: SoxR reducing system RseC family protein [bacterium]|nr:SoxR reducing system RseC family protein [bacterium]